MASGIGRGVLREIGTLFRVGSLGGLSDAELMELFVARRGEETSEAAFSVLVSRHGPLVWNACRRVLDDSHAADDAFQATFLVLARRCRSLGRRGPLAPWLHAVARRTALRARADSARRRHRERTVDGPIPEPAVVPARGDDLAEILHAEIDRLPTIYRSPVVLCDLEGRTHAEAAAQLHWPVGTVSGRLSRARDLLRGRLTRRGLAPSSGAIAATLAREARATIPPALAGRTTHTAMKMVAGQSIPMVVWTSATTLFEGAVMSMSKWKVACAVLLTFGTGAAGLAYHASGGPEDQPDARARRPSLPRKPTRHPHPARRSGSDARQADRSDQLIPPRRRSPNSWLSSGRQRRASTIPVFRSTSIPSAWNWPG